MRMSRICTAVTLVAVTWSPIPLALAGAVAAPVDESETAAARPTGTPTDIVVRVRARGARLITTDMGISIQLTDADTGEVLATGLTMGNRAGVDPALTAAFRTTLMLDRPRRLRATARGPLSYPHAAAEVSSTQWVLPGRHLRGDGWVLEMAGLVVTLQDVPEHVAADAAARGVPIVARVVMMCGCPTAPDTEWDASDWVMRVQLLRDGLPVAEERLGYAGETSTYSASVRVGQPGRYELLVYAFDPASGNAGIARQPMRISAD
jgi:hypothetical protein